jgi:hypothetical protein
MADLLSPCRFERQLTEESPVGTVDFPYLPLDTDESAEALEANRFLQMLNWQAERIAQMHAMVTEMYQIFEKLKPLVDGMPSMPMGMPMLPPMGGMPRR